MIKFENVTKIYPDGTAVLREVSFEIKDGEFVSIVGKSGAGKTTLVRLILGLESPTSGEVYFKGINLNDADSSKIQEIRRRIGGIYQDYKLLPTKTPPSTCTDPAPLVSAIVLFLNQASPATLIPPVVNTNAPVPSPPAVKFCKKVIPLI